MLPLAASAVGALLTEFAGVGELVGTLPVGTVPVATIALLTIGLLGSYCRAERIGIAVGPAELCFIPATLLAHPPLPAIASGLARVPLDEPRCLYLLAANIGAVIMTWMILSQRSAVIDRGLVVADLQRERKDTALDAITALAATV